MPPFDEEVKADSVCALVSGAERLFGFAVFHLESRAFRICEYIEDSHLSRTEALLLQLQPKVCCQHLLDKEDCKKLGRIADSCGVSLEEASTSGIKQVDLDQDLLRLLAESEKCGLSRHLEEQRLKQGMRALAALISHNGCLNEPANYCACTLAIYPMRSFMYLDKAAFAALNVLPKADESLRSSTSLLGFLNKCRSDMGQRRLRQWLTQPLTAVEEISRRHDVVEAFCTAEALLRQMEALLRHVPDLEKIASRLHCTARPKSKRFKATLEDLVSLYHCVASTKQMVDALSTYEGVHEEVLNKCFAAPLRQTLADCQNFSSLVERTIDLKQAEQRNYCISTAFDESLKQLAAIRDGIEAKMEAVRKDVETRLALPVARNEKAVSLTDSPDGRALRVTKKHQGAVQDCKGSPPLKILSIKKMEVIFTTADMEKLNKQRKEANSNYEKQSEQLVAKALQVAATYSPVMERLAETLGSLDVLAAFARTALSAPCSFVRPKLDPQGEVFSIRGAFHVLVVANSEKGFVANDLDMERNTCRLHIITGPNMGGKSTYIRSVALIALLNQIGSFVPCQSATLPVFDAVMCRVGASDMQLRGISTFMAEMLEASCILNTASERSLVIVDELGRGTSTSDGFGIAWAIAKYLVEEKKCFSLFATHFHELAALEHAVAAVRNKHATAAVDAATAKLTFLYSLADGAADQSYGAHVAELAGFPPAVVAAARQRAAEFESKSGFGRAAKRQRLEAGVTEEAMSCIYSATDEEDFARRALEKLKGLLPASAGG